MASTSTEHDVEKKHVTADSPGTSDDQERGIINDPTLPKDTSKTPEEALAILELVKAQDVHHPMHWPAPKRWSIAVIYCFLQLFVTLTSTTYVSAEWMIEEKFGTSAQITTLGQSMFVLGNAVGPAFLGPLRFGSPSLSNVNRSLTYKK